MKAYDNYILIYMERWLISIPRRMILWYGKAGAFYGYYDADYSSEELKKDMLQSLQARSIR